MIEIVPAAPHEYEPALALLFDRLPSSAQQASIADVMKALGSGRIALYGLLTARVDGALVGSILYMLQADRTAFVWPPATSPDGSVPETDDALLGEVIRQIEMADACALANLAGRAVVRQFGVGTALRVRRVSAEGDVT